MFQTTDEELAGRACRPFGCGAVEPMTDRSESAAALRPKTSHSLSCSSSRWNFS